MLITNNRLPRACVIKERKHFVALYDTGRVLKGRFVNIYFTTGSESDFRFGVTVTKKIGNAVVRNRSRRLIREFTRRQLKRLKRDVSVIIVVKREFLGRSYEEIAQSLAQLFRRAGFYLD